MNLPEVAVVEYGDQREVYPPVSSVLDLTEEQFQRLGRIAKNFAAAGVIRGGKKDTREILEAKAFSKLVYGRELGLSIAQSLGIQFVGSGLAMHYSLILSILDARGYRWNITKQDEEACIIDWYRSGEPEPFATTTYTMEMAEKAGLTKGHTDYQGNVTPSMYERFGSIMLLARNVSGAARSRMPSATRGMPVYVPGEVPSSDVESETGNVTDGAGTGEMPDVEIPPPVEEVIARAQKLGQAAYSDEAAVAVIIGNQPEEFVKNWVTKANVNLDKLEARLKREAEAKAYREEKEESDREDEAVERAEAAEAVADKRKSESKADQDSLL